MAEEGMSVSAPAVTRTALSFILPAHDAAQILGQSTVRSIVRSFLRFVAAHSSQHQTEDVSNGSSSNSEGEQKTLHPDISFRSIAESVLDPNEHTEETTWIDLLTRALFVNFQTNRQSGFDERPPCNDCQEEEVQTDVWKAWYRMRNFQFPVNIVPGQLQYPPQQLPVTFLGIDKDLALRLGTIIPPPSAPHSDPGGHAALMECLFNSMAYVPSPNAMPSTSLGSSLHGIGGFRQGNHQQQMVEEKITVNTALRNRPMILLPDLVIFFGIIENYISIMVKTTRNSSEPTSIERQAILTMANLSFRLYNGYQRRGVLTRDTLHRFLSDVHGEESLKRVAVKNVLDAMFTFDTPSTAANEAFRSGDKGTETRLPGAPLRHVAHLTAIQYAIAVAGTMTYSHTAIMHILLDWIVALGHAMLPTHSGLQHNTQPEMQSLLLSKMDMLCDYNPEVSIRRLCKRYGVEDRDLYEVKRKFRSVLEVRTKLLAEEAKVLTAASATGVRGGDDGEDDESEIGSIDYSVGIEGRHLPIGEAEGQPSCGASIAPSATSCSVTIKRKTVFSQDHYHRNMICEAAFIKIACNPNEEMGHGGFLTEDLARLTFRAGCIVGRREKDLEYPKCARSAEDFVFRNSSMTTPVKLEEENFWTMYDVLSFGCAAVRRAPQNAMGESSKRKDADLNILRFVFTTFLLLPRNDEKQTVALTITAGNDDTQLDAQVESELTRTQVGKMLLLLLEHCAFRLHADSPTLLEEISSEYDFKKAEIESLNDENYLRFLCKTTSEDTATAEKMVDASLASLLGLLPPKIDVTTLPESSKTNSREPKVSLNLLIDYVFAEATDLSTEELVESALKKKETLSFCGFLDWYLSPLNDNCALPLPQRRVGPFILDLRLLGSIVFGVRPSSPAMEKHLVFEVQRRHKYRYPQSELAKRGPMNTIWYIVHSVWWRKWVAQSDDADGDSKSNRPGKIDNNQLLVDNGSLALKSGMRLRHDFEFIPPLGWSALQAWYDGGPPIYRTVISYVPALPAPRSNSPLRSPSRSLIGRQNEIELYPLFVTLLLSDSSSRGEARPFQQHVPVSRYLPARALLSDLCCTLDVKPINARLWMTNGGTAIATGNDSHKEPNADWLLHLERNVLDQLKDRDQMKYNNINSMSGRNLVLLLELKDEKNGTWPRALRQNKDIGATKLNLLENENSMGDGIVGLYNLGNTCYLNSSIQCLSHTPLFRNYFTSKLYLNDINCTNPLGHRGRLAQVSAILINSLWKQISRTEPFTLRKKVSSSTSYAPISAPCLTPKSFKEAMGKLNDHFAGNDQHDAQELLAFMLSGLSEDLNRIVDKPYIEAPDSDGRPDKELADIWWSNHLKRDTSIIVALFTGQYKSLLTCLTCKYESARFEPFAFLQLPLPEDDQVAVQVVLYSLRGGSEAIKYLVRVRHDGTLFEVLLSLARALHADSLEKEQALADQAAELSEVEAVKEDDASTSTHEDDSRNKDQSFHSLEKTLEESGAAIKNKSDMEERVKVYYHMARNMAIVKMGEGYILNIISTSSPLLKLQNTDTGELTVLYTFELDPLPLREIDKCEAPSGFKKQDFDNKEFGDDMESANFNSEHRAEARKKFGECDTAVTSLSTSDSHKQENEQHATDDVTSNFADTSPTSTDVICKAPASPDVNFSYLAFMQRKLELINRPMLHPCVQKVFGTPMLLRVVELERYTGRDVYDLVAKRLRRFVPSSALQFLDNGLLQERIHVDFPIEGFYSDEKVRKGGRLQREKTFADMEDASAGVIPRYGFRLRIASRDGRRCALCPWFECCIGCLVPDDDYPTIVRCGDSIAIDWHLVVDLSTAGFGVPMGEVETLGNPQPQKLDSVKKHRTCDIGRNEYDYRGYITLEDCMDAFSKEEKIPETYCSCCKEFRVQMKSMSLWRLPPIMIIHLKRFQFTQHMRRKLRDLVVFPIEGLDLSRIVASNQNIADTIPRKGEFNGVHDPISPCSVNSDERSELLYDLYGVVHHQGALCGGHYVASLKSEIDGKWRLFNDAQIYEISDRDVVDASAYILFYVRRDVKDASLEDFWDTRTRKGAGMTEEEVEKMMKQREHCVTS